MPDIEDILELSPAQQGMLYQALSAPAPGLYVEQVCVHLAGAIDAPCLREAWQQVFEATGTLRSSFHLENLDRPMQVVHRHVQLPWTRESWETVGEPERARTLEAWLAREADQPFILSQAPLSRLALLTLDETDHRLVWTYHHLLLDGWSMALVVDDVLDRYDVLRRGGVPAISGRASTRAFVLWRQGQDASAAARFWRETLAGIERPVTLPGLRPAVRSDRGDTAYGTSQITLSREVSERLSRLARQAQVSLGAVLQGAWALHLARANDATDIVFGSTVSGRSPELPGADTIVGMLINTVPLRVTVDRTMTLAAWLQHVQDRGAAMRPYEHLPSVDIQACARVPPGTPLFESLLVVENYPVGRLSSPEAMGVRDVTFSGGRTHYPLVLLVLPRSELMIRAIYQRARLDRRDVDESLAALSTLLSEMCGAAGEPLSALLPVTSAHVTTVAAASAAASVSTSASASASALASASAVGSTPAPRMDTEDERELMPLSAEQLPRTTTERELAGIWREVLGLEQVARDSDFFDLGGHSLLAMQLLSRVREAFDIELTIIDLFTMTLTIASLGELIDRARIQPAPA